MLEQKIELLTAAVEALTKAIGGMQAPAPVSDVSAPLDDIKPTPKAEVPNEVKKSEDTSGTSQTSAPQSEAEPLAYADVQKVTITVSKISREKAIASLARFGVTTAKGLNESQWPEYVAYMTRVAAGEVDPESSHE